MRKTVMAAILLLPIPAQAGKEQYSSKRWYSWGSYGAIVLAMEDNQNDSKYYGLTVECSPSKGKVRVSIKDIEAQPNDLIRWESDKEMGSISNKASMVFRTSEDDVKLNERLLRILKSGNWIKFENTRSGSAAKYTLKGSSKAIKSIVSCK